MSERCVCCGDIIPEGRQVCPNCEHKAKKPNCEKCRYRFWLAKMDCHVDYRDCDEYGTDTCKKMNDPGFIKFMEGRYDG